MLLSGWQPLDIQVLDALGMGLDEGLARRYLFTHQDAEGLIGFNRIRYAHLKQGPGLRVHGGLPELLGGHFTQTFIALEIDLPVGLFDSPQHIVSFLVGIDPVLEAAGFNPVKRRLGNEQMLLD